MKKLSALFLVFLMIFGCIITSSAAIPYTNLVLESVFFTKDNGATLATVDVQTKDVVTSPQGQNNLIPYVVLSKNEGGTALAGSVTVATYDSESKLHGVSTFDINSGAVVFGEIAFGMDRTTYKGPTINFPTNGTAKAFFWNGITTAMIPYIAPKNSTMAPTAAQYTGAITFPTKFQSKITGKFTITKESGVRKYSHTATPQTIYDWSDATEIFLSTNLDPSSTTIKARTGLVSAEPIGGMNFQLNYTAGLYKKVDGTTIQNKFIFTLLDDFYIGATNPYAIPLNNYGTNSGTNGTNISTDINAFIRSGSTSGFTWMGRLRRQNIADDISQKWTAVDGKTGVYKTIQGVSTAKILTLLNFSALDNYGMPKPYAMVDSIDLCMAQKGSFYQDTTALSNIYCNPRDGENLDDISAVIETGLLDAIRNNLNASVVFQNIGFMPRLTSNNDNQMKGLSYDTTMVGFFSCKFVGGATNTLSFLGKYNAYVFDCISAYGFRDGLNFHADLPTALVPTTPTVIEVNTKSYNHGDTNRIGYSAALSASTKNSNNASTAHDGISILRVGGRYWNTQGPISADLNCLSITLGCEAYNFNTASPSERTAFLEYDDTTAIVMGKNKYIVDCFETGSKIRAGIVGNVNTYTLDFVGNQRFGLGAAGTANALKSITWAEIESGAWKE